MPSTFFLSNFEDFARLKKLNTETHVYYAKFGIVTCIYYIVLKSHIADLHVKCHCPGQCPTERNN